MIAMRPLVDELLALTLRGADECHDDQLRKAFLAAHTAGMCARARVQKLEPHDQADDLARAPSSELIHDPQGGTP